MNSKILYLSLFQIAFCSFVLGEESFATPAQSQSDSSTTNTNNSAPPPLKEKIAMAKSMKKIYKKFNLAKAQPLQRGSLKLITQEHK